ncbi:MAG: Beta-phenylalanine transaminase [Alphaproteobacteria bacterium MarineAlpha4_Bin2]|nr:MAG: Beta-phenylalanine transaminase [Alphaproteobacteria bacterium MarineAlpha4_Bin2]
MSKRPVAAALYERAKSVMPGGNTRITVFMKPHPYYASHGQGCRLTDADGIERLDFTNNYNSLIHGHAHPDIFEAVQAQLGLGTAFPMATEAEIRLAELLCTRVPSFEQIRFCNSGSEAVMFAVKAARAHTGRFKIAKCEGSYHGSYDQLEVSLDPTPETWGNGDPKSVPYVQGTPRSVLEDVIVIPYNKPDEAEVILRKNARKLACIVIDLMPNRGGLIPATPEFVTMLKRVRDDTGILLIFDEVITLRLALGGAQELFGIRPDLTATGKIIGGGFPVGAVAGSAKVMEVFDPRYGKPALSHSGTFNANPITMVAGEIAMRLLTQKEIDRIGVLGNRAREGIASVMQEINLPGQVTGLGSLFRIHVHNRPLSDYRSMLTTEGERALLAAIVHNMRDDGVFVNERGVCSLSTPMGDTEIDTFLACFKSAAEKALAER